MENEAVPGPITFYHFSSHCTIQILVLPRRSMEIIEDILFCCGTCRDTNLLICLAL